MDYAKMLNGGQPLMIKYQINETFSNAGIPVLAPGANTAGVQIGVKTSFANACGVTQDTATYVTAQQTDGTSAEREVTVCISPSAIFRALMSGSATAGTAMVQNTISSDTTDGLDVTDDTFTWTSPQWDEGSVYFTSGVNQGQLRKVTATSGSAATITVAFDRDHVAGDTYFRMPYWFMDDTAKTIQTTTDLVQADTLIAVGTGGAAKIIDMELNDTTDSYVLFIFDDHALRETT